MRCARPLAICLCLFACGAADAQTARPVGAVVAIDAAARRITLKTDAGPEIRIELQESTRFLRVAPGSQDLSGAARITLPDLSAGDRILARGRSGSAADSFVADTIIVMSKADLARKQETERADWEKRGIGGIVTAVDVSSREATIRTGGPKSTRTVVLQLPVPAKLRRYSADSIRFSDALASRLEELKIGDQVKARGTRSSDGARFAVEELVFGSFRDFGATIVAVDLEKRTLQLTDLTTKARVEARVLPASVLRRLPPEVVQVLAARIAGGEAGGAANQPDNGREVQTIIEGLPSLRLEEFKIGDAVVISGTTGEDPAKLTAITVLAGVESLLKPSARGARVPDIGSWNLELNMGVGVP